MASKNSKEKIQAPKAGDIVLFPRSLPYEHAGIADGEGNVIHATSDNTASGSVIKKEPLEKVASNGNFRISNQDDKKTPLPCPDIVSQANRMIGQEWPYNPVNHNCETFATEMRYGRGQGFSEQGQNIIKTATNVGTSFLNHAKDTHNHFEGK